MNSTSERQKDKLIVDLLERYLDTEDLNHVLNDLVHSRQRLHDRKQKLLMEASMREMLTDVENDDLAEKNAHLKHLLRRVPFEYLD